MLLSLIDAIKIVRKATYPQLPLVNAKQLVENCYPLYFGQGLHSMNISSFSELEPLFNLCLAYNQKVFGFTESNQIIWGESPFVTREELIDISRNPNRYIDQRS